MWRDEEEGGEKEEAEEATSLFPSTLERQRLMSYKLTLILTTQAFLVNKGWNVLHLHHNLPLPMLVWIFAPKNQINKNATMHGFLQEFRKKISKIEKVKKCESLFTFYLKEVLLSLQFGQEISKF